MGSGTDHLFIKAVNTLHRLDLMGKGHAQKLLEFGFIKCYLGGACKCKVKNSWKMFLKCTKLNQSEIETR